MVIFQSVRVSVSSTEQWTTINDFILSLRIDGSIKRGTLYTRSKGKNILYVRRYVGVSCAPLQIQVPIKSPPTLLWAAHTTTYMALLFFFLRLSSPLREKALQARASEGVVKVLFLGGGAQVRFPLPVPPSPIVILRGKVLPAIKIFFPALPFYATYSRTRFRRLYYFPL